MPVAERSELNIAPAMSHPMPAVTSDSSAGSLLRSAVKLRSDVFDKTRHYGKVASRVDGRWFGGGIAASVATMLGGVVTKTFAGAHHQEDGAVCASGSYTYYCEPLTASAAHLHELGHTIVSSGFYGGVAVVVAGAATALGVFAHQRARSRKALPKADLEPLALAFRSTSGLKQEVTRRVAAEIALDAKDRVVRGQAARAALSAIVNEKVAITDDEQKVGNAVHTIMATVFRLDGKLQPSLSAADKNRLIEALETLPPLANASLRDTVLEIIYKDDRSIPKMNGSDEMQLLDYLAGIDLGTRILPPAPINDDPGPLL